MSPHPPSVSTLTLSLSVCLYGPSIRHIGEQAGICKIVPPPGWRPPFALNDKTFRFRTRVQTLNGLDGHARAEGHFVDALRMFLYRTGAPMQQLPRVHGQLVNLRVLYHTVGALGGFDSVEAAQCWDEVVRRVGREGPGKKTKTEPDDAVCTAYRTHYVTCLLPFERFEAAEKTKEETTVSPFETPDHTTKRETVGGNKGGRMATATSVSSGTSVSDAAATPVTKTRSSMKKAERSGTSAAASNSTTEGVDATGECSPRVKRTLFSEGGHTSSEENDAPVKADDTTTKHTDDSDNELADDDDDDDSDPTVSKPPTRTAPGNLSPSGLKPNPTRQHRLKAPSIVAGQQFFQFFPDCGAVLATVKRVFGGKKPHVAVQYMTDGSRDDIDLATMQILVANGWDAYVLSFVLSSYVWIVLTDCADGPTDREAAELAYKSEICQTCLRGDCWEKMLLCDGCNSGHHLFCLDPPLADVPAGDWYCAACVDEARASDNHDQRDAHPKFGFEMGREYSVATYKEKADAWKRAYFGADTSELSDRALEAEYWRLLSIPVHEKRLEVEYGSDIDSGAVGSGFPRADTYTKCVRLLLKRLEHATNTSAATQKKQQLGQLLAHGLEHDTTAAALETLLSTYAQDDWNLNNLPKLPGSVLQHLDEDIKGVMVPWLYMGMCFSTFCWHVEDHNFYSMSYNHCGAPKTWYGVPGREAAHVEATMQQLTPELFGSQPDLHLQLVTMFSPATLRQHGVPVYRATHCPNEFMVTFPSAYHAGFNNGFNCAEAVNFATVDWLPWGAASVRKYRAFHKLPVFSHDALVCSLAETLVESSAFDSVAARAFVLPAMQQLAEDFNAFERQVSVHHVTTREWMVEFEARHRSSNVGLLPVRAAKKRMMATAGDCDSDRTTGTGASMRAGKMLATRPTRMVLWAGQSGKHDGLRCVACKQYCYLQAVVCTKCRPSGAVVGCAEHFATMCECDKATHYVYLHRYDAPHVAGILASITGRLQAVDDWHTACTNALAAKPRVHELQQLVADGKTCGGASQERLDELERAIESAGQWTAKADELLRSQVRRSTVDLQAVLALVDAAEALVAVPDQLESVERLLTRWRECERESTLVFQAVGAVQRKEAQALFNVRNPHDTSELWLENTHHQSTNASIQKILAVIVGMGGSSSSRTDSVASRLVHARQYLDVLQSANAAIAVIAGCLERTTRGENDSARDEPPPCLTESGCRLVVTKADSLSLEHDTRIFKVELLRSFLQVTEAEAADLEAALADRSKSTVELEALRSRLQSLPVAPDRLRELADRLSACRAWEAKARRLVDVSQPVAVRPTLAAADTFYSQADACFVPTTSFVRRQVHARLQDCRRWATAVHALFMKPTTAEPEHSLAAFLQTAIDTFHTTATATDHAPSRLHCVCEQVMPDTSHTVACQRCRALFHAQCVGATAASARLFVCRACQPTLPTSQRVRGSGPRQLSPSPAAFPSSVHLRATLGSQGVPLFCHCRGAEDASMICCDFCDEWYHTACIGMPLDVLTRIEAFRCQRCALKQNLYYLDRKALRRDVTGRRPAATRVDACLNQLEMSLVALPPGARELAVYMGLVRQLEQAADAHTDRFASELASHALAQLRFATEEAATVALLRRVTALEVALDAVQSRLGSVHWCLRACRTVLGCDRAPKYAHLVLLLEDAQTPGFAFPRTEFQHVHVTIADRVLKAARWLKQAKSLEVEEWNVEKARRLERECRELSQFLELPVAEVTLVHQVVANADTDDTEFASDKRRRLV